MLTQVSDKVSILIKKIFRKKATPQEIGLNFVEMILNTREAKRETQGTLAALSEKTRERVQFETMLLQGFMIEYVTFELFRDRPERQGILAAYRGVLDDLAGRDPVWKAFDAELRLRLLRYTEAVLAPTLDALLTRVGDAFAEACGDAGNGVLSTLGILEFQMQYVATYKLCRACIGAFA